MKNKFIKLVSSLLVFSFLAAAFSVFSFADDTGAAGSDVITENLEVFTIRDFDEGWDAANGFNSGVIHGSNEKNVIENKVEVDREVDVSGKYNYFARFEAVDEFATKAEIGFGGRSVNHSTKQNTPGTVLEFSIKADDVATLGNILYMKTSVAKKVVRLLDVNKDGDLIIFGDAGEESINLGKLGNQWINIAFIFDWNRENLGGTLKIGYGYKNGYTKDIEFDIPYAVAGDIGASAFDFIIPAAASRAVPNIAESKGMSYCIDNLKVYHGVRRIVEFSEGEYGSFVDSLEPKVVEIIENANDKTKDQILEETLAMKLGVDYALMRNVRYPLVNNADGKVYNGVYGAPVKIGDDVFVPLALIIDYIGYPAHLHKDNMSYDITTGTSTTYITVGRNSATVDGKRVELKSAPGYIQNSVGESYLVANLADISTLFPGWLTFYDDMGLVVLYEDATPENLNDNEVLLTRKDNLSTMVNIMKKFVFDTVTDSEIDLGYIANGEKVYEDTKQNTNDFAHPYLVADSDTFENLAKMYALTSGSQGYDKALKSYIQTIIDKANSIYSSYANVQGTVYVGINPAKVPLQPGTSDGYDAEHGDMAKLLAYAETLPVLAFAFQITGNENYAKLAYDISAAMAKWNHWGPAYVNHFAKITSDYAIAYDWLYNEYKALGLDTDVLANAIFELGVHDGYVSSAGKACEHARSAYSDLSVYNISKDSINAIGSSGMIIGALAILDYVCTEDAPKDARAETMYLIGNNIQSLITYGLDIYAPDGSYIETPVIWESATSSFFRLAMAFETATGSDYGFLDTWGMERTCYYSIHIENSDGFIWNYHDSTAATALNTDMFFYAGARYGDENLIAVRHQQLSTDKEVTIYDLLFYPIGKAVEAPELSLDYHMEAIEGYVSRSDWNSGAIYTGLMGGRNDAANSQLDSGNFIYYNKGVSWIIDLGAENPYLEGITDAATRYKYYRNSAEGQNVIIKTNDSKVPYGQNISAGGYITKTFTNEFGSYVLLDNTDVYKNGATGRGTDEISYSKRGVLFTNNRSTVVLQDELAFVYNGSVTWVAHTEADVMLDETARVAYMTRTGSDGTTYTVRATIVSKNPNFKFRVDASTTNLLSSTETGKNEITRDNIRKLVIEVTDITLFEIAVVFELVENTKDKTPVAYSWSNMNDWVPGEYNPDDFSVSADTRKTPEKDEMDGYIELAALYLRKASVYTKTLELLYKTLADTAYLLKLYPEIKTESALNYAEYADFVERYETFMGYVNENVDFVSDLALALSGIKTETDAE